MANGRYPIVLAHGIARFDILRDKLVKKIGIDDAVSDNLHYFRRIKSHLEANDFEVHHTSVEFAGSVELRAKQLGDQIKQILSKKNAEKVHIIAHSMGGLDARHMIVDLDDMAEKVASLTTIGTPHLGTSFADIGLIWGGQFVIDGLRSIFDLQGFAELTREHCRDFNQRAEVKEADNKVIYRTWASAEERDRIFLPLQPSWFIINNKEGENDGLVSVTSQHWKKELIGTNGRKKTVEQLRFPVPADHLNEIGWWDSQEDTKPADYEAKIRNVYLQIAKNLS